ncbi:MAG: acyl-CoA dehydrogenase family protein [Pseudomonadota bacterium]
MSDTDEQSMIVEATARILADLADPQTVNAAKDEAHLVPLWQALEEAGLTRAWVPENKGGAGVSLAAGFEILRIAGQYACPVALAETLIAGWAMAEAGLDVPKGPLAILPVRARDRLTLTNAKVTGAARAIPHAAGAGALVVIVADQLMTFMPGDVVITPRAADMGDHRADVTFDGATPQIMADMPGGAAAVERIGAVARACQMTGALETALSMTTDYTGEREAFGRKIGKFQAVQQNLAILAGEVAAALTASGSAADTLSTENHLTEAAFLEVAAAKIRCGEAVEKGAGIAHQAHGAIGWTQDYTLQMFTRRMFGWRNDFGTESDWAVRLGTHIAAKGAEQLWPMITTR